MKNEPSLDGRAGPADPLDDPRLTAYVLDELAPDARRSLEQELQRKPELADAVRALDGLATGLRVAFSDAGQPRLDAARKAEILRAARAPEVRPRSRWPRRIAVAASLVALTGAMGWFGMKVLLTGEDVAPTAHTVSGTEHLQELAYGGKEASPAASSPRATAPTPEVRSRLDALGYGGNEIDRSSVPSVVSATPPQTEDLQALGYGGGDAAEQSLESHEGLGYVGLIPPVEPGSITFHGGSAGVFTLSRDSKLAPLLGYGGKGEDLGETKTSARSTSTGTGSDGWFLGHGKRMADREEPQAYAETPGTEAYDAVSETPFRDPRREPLSTFSIDVDTASYANVRRFLSQRQLPPPGAVRIEEMVNYFSYAYPEPRGKMPFSVSVDSASCPWEPTHRLVRIGLKGRAVDLGEPRTKNLVFLVDVSGSMDDPAKLPLVQKSLRLLVNELRGEDRVALVVYAGNSGLVLPATQVTERARILDAIDGLSAGGSTNGGEGIQLAYATAQEHFAKGGVNRVILATDGDFNVGITDRGALLGLIEEKAKSGVFLSVLGFGTGNLKDATMEQLADRGNGNYAYVDSLAEARKVLVREMGATLETIAKDVKIQVEFNPAKVGAWRLVGYENRMLAARDFNDDKKDAGEIGAGHTVTALYEIVPIGTETTGVDALRYQTPPASIAERTEDHGAGELLTVKLRYKEPSADMSELLSQPFTDGGQRFEQSGADLRFAAAVAAFGLCLRGSEQRGSATLEEIHRWAEGALGEDPHGDRREFLRLVDVAAGLSKR